MQIDALYVYRVPDFLGIEGIDTKNIKNGQDCEKLYNFKYINLENSRKRPSNINLVLF